MHSRRTVLEKFSKFIQFESDRFKEWSWNPRLRQSAQRCLETLDDQEALWVRYWHQVWQEQPDGLAYLHFLAYLQEPCYYVTKEVLTTYQQYLSLQDGFSGYFNEVIVHTPTVLDKFNSELASLNTYATKVFRKRLTRILRERKETEASSRWALLRRVRNKRFTEALERLGLTTTQINQYRLAWECFKVVYAPTQSIGTGTLPDPDPATWQAIAELYNRERLSRLNPPGPPCSPAQIEQWILRSANAIQNFRRLATVSADAPAPGQESGGLVDNLPDPMNQPLMDQWIAAYEIEERNRQKLHLEEVLLTSLKAMEQQMQTIVNLYYQQGLKQQQIADQLGIKQTKVCRRLSKAEEILLMDLVKWSQQELNKAPTPDLIERMNGALEEWLKIRYRELGGASDKGIKEGEQ